jgi:hypothetical protein
MALGLSEHCDKGPPILRTVVALVTFTYMKIVMAQGVTATRELRQGVSQVVALRRRKDLRQNCRKYMVDKALEHDINPGVSDVCPLWTDAPQRGRRGGFTVTQRRTNV